MVKRYRISDGVNRLGDQVRGLAMAESGLPSIAFVFCHLSQEKQSSVKLLVLGGWSLAGTSTVPVPVLILWSVRPTAASEQRVSIIISSSSRQDRSRE